MTAWPLGPSPTCGGDGLVQPIAAAVDGAAGGAQGLPRLNEVGDLIYKIQIQRSIAENVRHTAPPYAAFFRLLSAFRSSGQHRDSTASSRKKMQMGRVKKMEALP